MKHQDIPFTTTTTPRRTTTRVGAAMVGLGTVAALVAGTASQATAATAPDTSAICVPSQPTTAWKPAVTLANAMVTKTLNNLASGNLDKAAGHLRILRHQVRIANTAATALIGRPPTDPESDEPPGPAAVQRVAALDHSITVKLLPPFHGLTAASIVQRLGTKLDLGVACRDTMLAKVIALKPAARDDYVDGLSDTLPSYDQEQKALTTALAASDLTPAARTYLETAQAIVTSTQTEMNRVFGGGERSPALPR